MATTVEQFLAEGGEIKRVPKSARSYSEREMANLTRGLEREARIRWRDGAVLREVQ